MSSTFPPKPNYVREIFGRDKVIIGVIHLLPLPGAPRYEPGTLAKVLDSALADARSYAQNGVHGLIVENGWDLPFLKPNEIGFETIASMTAVTQRLITEVGLPTGISCQANAATAALAIGQACGARFVRVSQWVNAYVANEGFIEGVAARALRYRSFIKADDVRVFADVHVKGGSHAIIADRDVTEQARDAVWFDADVLIATGNRTGEPAPFEEIDAVRSGTDLPVLVGSGTNTDNIAALLAAADGCIVGSSVKQDGLWWNPVEARRVRDLVDASGLA